MDEHELIDWLGKQIGRPIPPRVLKLLRDDGYLHLVDDDDPIATLNRTRLLLQLTSGDPPRRHSRRITVADKTLRAVAKRDEIRRDAVSEYWARDASTASEVKRFRREVLRDRLLTSDEAQDFLISPAALMFSSLVLAANKVDPARHKATVVKEEAKFLGPYHAVVHVEQPATDLKFEVGSTEHNVWDGERPRGTEQLFVRVEGRVRVEARAWLSSVVAELKRAADSLERHNYPWLPGDAAWFILTGETPKVAALGHSIDWRLGSQGNRAVIKIHVEPWISANRVTALYRDLQRQILGRHNRPVSERRVALFHFVTTHMDDDGKLPPWRRLLEDWNKRQPRYKYDNVRNFSRDYWAAARLLLFPKLHLT